MEKRPGKPNQAAKPANKTIPGAAKNRLAETADEMEDTQAPKKKLVQKAPVAIPAKKQPDLSRTRPVSQKNDSEDDAAGFLLDNEPEEDEEADDSDSDFDLKESRNEEEPADEEPEDRPDMQQTQALDEESAPKLVPPDDTQVFDSAPTPGSEQGTAVFDEEEPAAPAPPPKAPAAPAQKNVVGDYRLIKKLGQGGMGTVYKAHQLSLDREVALKVLSRETAAQKPALVQRFQREARVMAKLDHPNILRCYEVNQFHGLHYFTMEFVDGGSVQDWLTKLKKFSIGDAIYVILACARGLQHAHEQNMIHRDIKPENILVTKKGVIKVADMGLAKALDENLDLTRTGTGAGTPVYMAPEQARDVKHVDHRSDIYSLGCMLHALLSGEPPFKGETVVELFEAKNKGSRPPSRSFNSEIPSKLDLMIDKMLATKPEQRYQSCAEIIDALEELELANDRLSFLAASEPATLTKRPAGPATKIPAAAAKTSTAVKARPTVPHEEVKPDRWFVKIETGSGETMTKKVSRDKLIAMIRLGTVSATTPTCKTMNGDYRNLATITEFTSLLQAKAINEKADKKGEKFRGLYAKIEKQENWRLRKRWVNNLFLRFGGFIGLLIWLAIIGAVGVGIWYLINHGMAEMFRQIGY